MQATRFGALMLLGLLAACGSDSGPSGIKVSCRGTSVQPLTDFEMRVQPATAQKPAAAVLVYKDPLNRDVTASLRVDAGESCTVGPAIKVK